MTDDAPSTRRLANFLTDIIDADLEAGKHREVVTRFPPEPNGFLHIGHAKSICLNFGLAEQYGGACHLRFDDTNPVTENEDYVRAIQDDVTWLGFTWSGPVRFASDYFERFYELAESLVDRGLAYVDEQPVDAIRAQRGSLTEPGTNSPYRDRSVEENRRALRAMRDGAYPDGGAVLRARIDMAAANPLMRDPALYRVRHAHHHRTGDAWCIYPMYDYAHCLEDAIEGITHSICTLEFENNRELYDWVIEHTGCIHPDSMAPPRQYEFARLNLGYTVMSKRKLLKLVEDGLVSGWDDPRMPTIAGIRRRGVTPEAVRAFADMIGVSKANSLVDIGKFEFCVRDDLNHRAPRVLCVLDPLRVVLTNVAESDDVEVDAPLWPDDIGHEGTRPIRLGRTLYIEREDYADEPPRGWHRLAPGREVRLRHGWVIRCDEAIRDEQGHLVELRCTADLATLNANPEGRRVRGVIHWVDARTSLPVEVRLYDRLFRVERPDADPEVDFRELLHPESLVVRAEARIEPFVRDALARPEGDRRFQFERRGYFFADPVDCEPDRLVFNRIVTLKDTWARTMEPAEPSPQPSAAAATPRSAPDERVRPAKRTRAQERAIARERNPALLAAMERLRSAGFSDEDADQVSGDEALATFVEAALARTTHTSELAKWATNDLVRLAGDTSVDELNLTPEDFAQVVDWVVLERITTQAGRQLLELLLESDQEPEALLRAHDLERRDDSGALAAVVAAVLEEFPDERDRYRTGKVALLGFFTGHVMRRAGAGADARAARTLLQEALGPVTEG